MPNVSLDPEIKLTLQREGRPVTSPESQPEKRVCILTRQSLIWELQKCKVLGSPEFIYTVVLKL